MEIEMTINMSYCRMENTLAALRECAETLDDKGLDGLSDREREAARQLLELCSELAGEYGGDSNG